MPLTVSWDSSKVVSLSGSGGQAIGDVVTTDKFTTLAAVSSAELAAKVTDETGTGLFVLDTNPTIDSPTIYTPTLTSPIISGNPNMGTSLNRYGGSTSSFPAIKRAAAVLEIKLADDSAYSDLKSRTVITPPVAVADLPVSPVEGQRAFVNNSNAVSYLLGLALVVVGGGTTHCPVIYDGTNWRIG